MYVEAGVSVIAAMTGVSGAHSVTLPGQLDPGVVTDTSGPLRGAVLFALILVSGWAILTLDADFVDDSVDSLLDRPAVAVLYGVAAYVIVMLVGLYGVTTLARVSVAGGVIGQLGILITGGVVLVLTGFGFLVVGTVLTEIHRYRRPMYGVVIGACLSAVCWTLLPPARGLLACVAVAAFGIGGSVRVWIHSERVVKTERDG